MKLRIATVFIFLLFIGSLFAKDSNFSIVEKGQNYLKIRFESQSIELNRINTAQGNFINALNINAAVLLEKAHPALPYYSFSLHIPQNAKVNTKLTILEKETQVLDFHWLPSKGKLYRDTDPGSIPYELDPVYQMNQSFPGILYKSTEVFDIREFHGLAFHIYPYQYNGSKKELEIITSMEIIISWDQKSFDSQTAFEKENQTYQNIASRLFLNIESNCKYTPLSEEGNMLIICKDEWMDMMEEYVEWRIQSGIPTEMVSDNEVGNTESAILNYVENYYNTNGLTFLLIVGDVEVFPPRTNGVGGPSDQGYGYLVGNDHYPDIIVGRFSADYDWQLQTQIQRTLQYEKGELESYDWLKKTAGIASAQGPGDDNEMDWQHVRNLQNQLVQYTYTNPTYEFYDGSQGGNDAPNNPSGVMVKDALNDGAGALWYTGHGVVTGWSTSYFDSNDILDLENQGKLPYIYSTACLVGAFEGDSACFAETWQRATRNGQPIGAVANFSSSILQPWSPPMEGQDEIVEILTESVSGNIKRTFGGVAVNGCYSMNEVYGADANEVTDTWVIFGDPALMLRTDVPEQITATYDEFVLESISELVVNCNEEGARVVISDGFEVLGSSTVNGGIATIELDDLELGQTYQLTITAFNCLPFFGNLIVTTEEPLIVIDYYEVNGEQALTYAQSQNIDIILSNVGLNNASSVIASLTSSDPYVVGLTNNQNIAFGNIDGSGGSATSSGSFSAEISNEVPDQYLAVFDLNVQEGSQSWDYELEIPVNAPLLQIGLLTVNDEVLAPQFTTNPVTQVNPGAYYEYNINVEQAFGNGNYGLDAGEQAHLEFQISNIGHAAISSFNAQLATSNAHISLNNNSASVGSIEAGQSTIATFDAEVNPSCPTGEVISFELDAQAGFYSVEGYIESIVGKVTESFETNDFEYLNWNFPNSNWILNPDSFDGSLAASSPEIDNNESTYIEVQTNLISDGYISFYIKVSSEPNADKCHFKIDGEEILELSGEMDWSLYSFPVSAGNHTISWEYSKDFIFADGDDKVWIDQISFPPLELEGNNIRINSNSLTAWLNLNDHLDGSATLSGTAPANNTTENIQLIAQQNNITENQEFNLEVGLVNISNINMEEISIYPNPFTESIQLETEYKDGFTLFVSDIHGKLIKLQTYPNSKTKVDLDMLQPGTYVIKIVSKGKIIEKKMVKI